ncbi:hypothetical protein CY34DRAFT_8254 [Suillus luteus UH-Slu-Lm8-n1]|uniref:SF3A2 domain-containing protein n=1 Tax=Suillus luteus UH-Slu-Lm8-n1 TaxID=930992 RepID=A0A0D0ADX6_9AGAM|nr:hypothetical protein CY34DRAFT_8254 [Suillus luteus UH-Slu-Lm8-n1]
MSAWEQKRASEQGIPVAAGPYETIAFRIPAREIEDEVDDAGHWNWSYWDPDTKQYMLFSSLVMRVPDYLDQFHPDKFNFHLEPSDGE